MGKRLTTEQIRLIEHFKNNFAEQAKGLTDEQILTILNDSLQGITLSEDQQVSILGLDNQLNNFSGTKLEKSLDEKVKQALESRVKEISDKTKKSEENNGFIATAWGWLKNTLNFGDSSEDVIETQKTELDILKNKSLNEVFTEITGLEATQENKEKFLNGELKTKSETALEEYETGQEEAADFGGDLISGIGSTLIYSAGVAAIAALGAPVLAAGGIALAAAGILGAGIKVATKAAGNENYNTLGKDILTGFVNGLIAPVSAGFGGAIAKKVVTRLGGTAVKEGVELVAKKGIQEGIETVAENSAKGGSKFIQEALLNPMGYKYGGSKLVTRTGYLVEFGFDGSVSGSVDSVARTAYDGGSAEDIAKSAAMGAGMGALGAIGLGSLMKKSGNSFHKKGTDTGTNIRENFELRKGKAYHIDLATNDAFLREKGITDEIIKRLKELKAYHEFSTYIHVCQKYMPESVDDVVKNCLKDLDGLEAQAHDLSPECLTHFGEITALAEKSFKNMKPERFIDSIMGICSKDSDEVLKNIKILEKYGKHFQKFESSAGIHSLLQNLRETTDSKILSHKITIIDNISASNPSVNSYSLTRILEDATPEEIKFKANAIKILNEDKNLKEKICEIISYKPETISLILKIYKEAKNDSSLWEDPLEFLLKTGNHNLDSQTKLFDFANKLKKEGINIKFDNYSLSRLSQIINNDSQIKLLKELAHESPELLTKENLYAGILDCAEIIRNDAQKDLLKYSIKNRSGLQYYKEAIEFITEPWQTGTAISMLQEGIDPNIVQKVILNNRDKTIDDFIQREAILARTGKFVAEEVAYTSSPKHLALEMLFKYTGLDKHVRSAKDFQLPLFEKIAKLDFQSYKSSISGFYPLMQSLDSELKVKYVVDMIDRGLSIEDVIKIYTTSSMFKSSNTDAGITNIYKSKLFDRLEFEPWAFEALSKFEDGEVVDSIIRLQKENGLNDFNALCNFFSPDTKTAKAQLKLLEDVLKFEPNYVKDHCKDFWGTSSLFNEYLSYENVIIQHEFFNKVLKRNDFPNGELISLCSNVNKLNANFADELLNSPRFSALNQKAYIAMILGMTNETNIDIAIDLTRRMDFPLEAISSIVHGTNANNKDFVIELCNHRTFPKEEICDVIERVNPENIPFARELCNNYKELGITPRQIAFLLNNMEEVSLAQMQKLNNVLGIDAVSRISDEYELRIATQLLDLCKKTSINEIPLSAKKDIIRRLIACNDGLFNISNKLAEHFPLIPKTQEEYCELLPALVRSMGIETNPLSTAQINIFHSSTKNLASTLADITDSDFAKLKISQSYSKDEFITNVLKKVENLSPQERQKVYDYFGFDLYENNKTTLGHSIEGYPRNLNNGKKLAEITDPETKKVVESLRKDVIEFSEKNPIKCNNPEVEKILNDVIELLPELRATIGKTQHGSHHFDVMQHSLKVMQKIAQSPNFKTLDDSDQKIMMIAALLHDVTKRESMGDSTHAHESAFDTFFISKKFDLTREEEIKLQTLCQHHEWLGFVNTSKSEEELTRRLQSVAYDLQHDNLFEMALIFTHADLKAVKVDDYFHDSISGSSRVDFNGNIRSFGDSAEVYAQRIRNYIEELKTSQPILPVTKMPKASRIQEAITVVHPDGSTNIKGVYKDKDGLIVIKYNEVTDWETIGFPNGSVSSGYKIKKGEAADILDDVDTGNIKFFVHGLDWANQLAKFDAFSMPNSEVLLSVSYAERPESKFRFFRPQGVILDVDTKYIHGGGQTDAGSGCGKFVEEFKKNYVFGGARESDRKYISNLIKDATGMSDDEYVKFIKKYQNKPLSEVEPTELREKIIQAFASINSNTRKGNRAYNEMYISNPNGVMGVFAYNTNYHENVGNPIEFLARKEIGENELGFGNAGAKSAYERTEFLRKYALERDLPFVVFGD